MANRSKQPDPATTHNPPACDHLALSGPGWTSCIRCGSTCERNEDGRIIYYERGDLDRPRAVTTAWSTPNEPARQAANQE
jgi:hypothetical protein